MTHRNNKIYEKTATLLLSVFREVLGSHSFLLGSDITDRKNKILVRNFGEAFARENILFVDNFLFFAPALAVTYDSIRCNDFEEEACPDKRLYFKEIKSIQYNLMPAQEGILIDFYNGTNKVLFSGENPETYAAIKAYEASVRDGSYKARTVCFVACLYALTALQRSNYNDYESIFAKIEANVQKLITYYKDASNETKKYGDFFSFDFVTCKYEQDDVTIALERISEVKEAMRIEEAQERGENLSRAWERKLDETKRQYDQQQR